MRAEESKVESIFYAAMDKESTAERAAYLDGACAGDPELRSRVGLLLDAQPKLGRFLENGGGAAAPTIDQPITEKPGTLVGPYKLLEQIGEGGMGLVFMARQQEPVKRNVALKVIKPGMDSKQVIARFEAERQALALMEHPNIARVLDAGSTESGRPYFVMDLVRGIPITDYCDRNRLSTRERLDLFVSICQAVQHAHQKGIIHRDLKPTNVLVTSHDGTPVPKVIDFGIAKATRGQLTDETLVTNFAQMIGTPLYMSPEQAEMSGLDVDTRSDVYSLGVLLYELLTGTTPFEREKFSEVSLDELRRIIREDEPPKPSTRLSTLDAALDTVAEKRQTDSRTLRREVSGELDWIVMKALEKDRTRRYETASDLAKDVTRYLNDEPVEACPPSAAYRFRKFSRRHRTIFAAGAAVIMALVVGAAIATGQAIRATKAEGIAEERLTVADKQRRLAKQQQQLADRQKELAEQQREEAVRQHNTAQRNLYLASMQLAHHDWEEGQISRMLNLVDRHLPDPGKPDLRSWEWYYLLSLCYQDVFTLRGHEGMVTSLAWSPDGKLLASGGEGTAADGIKLWNATTGEAVLTLPCCRVRRLAFSPDGGRLAAVEDDSLVRIWHAVNGEQLLTLRNSLGVFQAVAWSPDGRQLATAQRGRVTIWSGATGEEVQSYPVPGSVNTVAWSPDGNRLAFASSNHDLRILEVSTGRQLVHKRSAHRHDLCSLDWSGDGKRLVSGSFDMTVKVWEADTGKELLNIEHDSGVKSVVFSPDDKRLASASRSEGIQIWNATTGKKLLSLRGHRAGILSVVWSPDGERLASGGSSGTVKIWAPSRQEVARSIGPSPCSRFLWSPDGLHIASRGTEGIEIWDSNTGQVVRSLSGEPPFSWSPDNNRLATVGGDRTVTLLDIHTGKESLTLDIGSGESKIRSRINAIDWSPTGNHLAVSYRDANTLRIFDTSTGQLLRALHGCPSGVSVIRWSPDGQRIAAAAKGPVIIWDAATGKRLLILRHHLYEESVSTIAWSPDGTRLASGGWDQTLKVWDSSSGDELLSLQGHGRAIGSVAWHPDGKRIASVSGDSVVRIWDVSSGYEVGSLEVDGASLGQVAWSPDGRRFVAAGGDGPMKIWDASFGYEFANHPDYRRDRACHLVRQGRHLVRQGLSEEAIEILRALVAEFPDVLDYRTQLASAYCQRGEARAARGEFGQAIADYSEAISIQRESLHARGGLTWLLMQCPDSGLRDIERALELAKETVQLAPYDGRAWHMLGKVHYQAGHRQEALAAWKKLMMHWQFEALGNPHVVAQTFWELGYKSKAWRHLERGTKWIEAREASPNIEYYRLFRDETAKLLGADSEQESSRGPREESSLIPDFAPQGRLNCIDLQAKTNLKLTESFHGGVPGQNFANLPQGEQTFAGVRFVIADGLIVLGNKPLPGRPMEIKGIPVNREFANLYILHATAWGSWPPYEVADGEVIGRYHVHYQDNTMEAIPVVYGEHVRNWAVGYGPMAITQGKIGWAGKTPNGGQIQLYVTRWQNPHPDKKVTSIDCVSTNADAAPLCGAMTVEEAVDPATHKGDDDKLPGATNAPAPARGTKSEELDEGDQPAPPVETDTPGSEDATPEVSRRGAEAQRNQQGDM